MTVWTNSCWQLVNQRALVAEQVGELKKKEGSTFSRPDRVAQVIEKIKTYNPARSKARTWPPSGARSCPPAWRWNRPSAWPCSALKAPSPRKPPCEYFGGAADFLYCNTFEEVFHATAAGSAQYGVVGVENSTEGVVNRTLDMFRNTPCHIVGEVSLLIRHHLLRSTNTLEGIEVVAAHPQALAQCHAWLSQHLPHAERSPGRKQRRRRTPGRTKPHLGRHQQRTRRAAVSACTSSAHAIQDDAYNPHGALPIICLPHTLATPAPTGKDCTSLVISVPNRPGAVHDLLVPLKTHGVSMTRFESRPARTGQWKYYFYIDLEGHPAQPNVGGGTERVASRCRRSSKVLGTYPTPGLGRCAMFEQLGLIGCGLMGGCFALALKKAGLVQRVVGYSKSPTTTARACTSDGD